MSVTREMRLERALEYLKDEKQSQEKEMEKLEGIRLREIIIIRNKKAMYMAELDQAIRNLEDDISSAAEGKTA